MTYLTIATHDDDSYDYLPSYGYGDTPEEAVNDCTKRLLMEEWTADEIENWWTFTEPELMKPAGETK
jgi:hypothetical protein